MFELRSWLKWTFVNWYDELTRTTYQFSLERLVKIEWGLHAVLGEALASAFCRAAHE